jgi:uncharacterized membrane protein
MQVIRRRSVAVIQKSVRLIPLDALRGLIIVLMALDHANIFVAQKHSSGEYWGGDFPVYHDSLAFLTRLVTHLAAPGFFFLMGAGMVLMANARRKQGQGYQDILPHFWIRGLVLIALQVLVVDLVWDFGVETYLGVLYGLGCAMIAGSLLLWMPPRYLLALSVAFVLVIGQATFPADQWAKPDSVSTLSRLLIVPGGDRDLWVNYPPLPWLGLTLFGMAFGGWLVEDAQKAFDRAWKLGVVLLMVFVVLRVLDGFGNIRPRAGDSWIDFLNMVKYPPSITFLLSTTGVNLILLGAFARAGERVRQWLTPLVIYGRAPLFFYVVHLFMYKGMGRWLTPNGTSIPAMVPIWLAVLVSLLPMCFFYREFKQHPPMNRVLGYL